MVNNGLWDKHKATILNLWFVVEVDADFHSKQYVYFCAMVKRF